MAACLRRAAVYNKRESVIKAQQWSPISYARPRLRAFV
jgi:hypothetical protein